MDESGSDGCVGVSSSLALALALPLAEDDVLADPDADTDADTDADPDADPDTDAAPDTDADPDVAVPEGRLDGSGGGMLGDGVGVALRLGVGTGTDGAGTAGRVADGDGEAEWSGAGDGVAVDAMPVGDADARPDAVLVAERLRLGTAGPAAGVPGSPPSGGAVLAASDGSGAGAGWPSAFSGGREPDRLVDRVGADASRPIPPVG